MGGGVEVSNPLKALHLVKTSVGAIWALRQMRELVKLGVEVHVALPAGGPLIPEYKSSGIIVHPYQFDFPIRHPWRCLKMFGDLRKLVSKVKPDIVHSHFVGTALTMRLALGKRHPIPRIFQVPGPLHLEKNFFRQAEILTAGDSDYWMGSCQWTCGRYLNSGISEDHLFLSYYGVDTENFVRNKSGKLRKELKVDTKTKLIGMVAYMYPPKRYLGQTRGIKGHEDLIDALAICVKSEPNMMGIFIGGAWNNAVGYENKIRLYGQKRCGNHVIFLGTRDDVPELYPDLDVVVHPSHSENIGGAAESLLFAKPTIATDIGGFPDLIKHGETGWLVPTRNPQRLAEAISEALRDPAYSNEMALRGQAFARRLFDVKETARQVLEVYKNILGRHRL